MNLQSAWASLAGHPKVPAGALDGDGGIGPEQFFSEESTMRVLGAADVEGVLTHQRRQLQQLHEDEGFAAFVGIQKKGMAVLRECSRYTTIPDAQLLDNRFLPDTLPPKVVLMDDAVKHGRRARENIPRLVERGAKDVRLVALMATNEACSDLRKEYPELIISAHRPLPLDGYDSQFHEFLSPILDNIPGSTITNRPFFEITVVVPPTVNPDEVALGLMRLLLAFDEVATIESASSYNANPFLLKLSAEASQACVAGISARALPRTVTNARLRIAIGWREGEPRRLVCAVYAVVHCIKDNEDPEDDLVQRAEHAAARPVVEALKLRVESYLGNAGCTVSRSSLCVVG